MTAQALVVGCVRRCLRVLRRSLFHVTASLQEAAAGLRWREWHMCALVIHVS